MHTSRPTFATPSSQNLQCSQPRGRPQPPRLHASRTALVPISVNPPVGRWSVGVLRRLCADMNLHPDFAHDIKRLAYDGSIPRDVDWVKRQLLHLHALESRLRLPPQSLLQHAAREPRALAHVDQLWPRFQRLATLLDVPAERLATAVAHCQALLLRETDDIAAIVRATCTQLRLQQPAVAEAAVAWPYVLLREPRAHNALCQRLRWYAECNGAWGEELVQLQGRDLVVVLQADHAKLDRLEYLMAASKYKRRDAVGLLEALQLSDAAFARCWPNFRSWCMEHNLVGVRADD